MEEPTKRLSRRKNTLIQNESIVKVPQGRCSCCGKDYGILVLVETGEAVNEYSDCECYDSIIEEELVEEQEFRL
jgi:hypothetical protein